MSNDRMYRLPSGGWSIIGGLIIIAGLLSLWGSMRGVEAHQLGWPMSVIAPGILLFALALSMASAGHKGATLIGFGSALTIIGFVLLYQSITNRYESWAYTWALIPTAIGLGLLIYGRLKDLPDLAAHGQRLAAIGGALFIGFTVFFEGVLGIGGLSGGGAGLGRFFWLVVLIGLGILLVLGDMLFRRRA